jgi:hypothetical protein
MSEEDKVLVMVQMKDCDGMVTRTNREKRQGENVQL